MIELPEHGVRVWIEVDGISEAIPLEVRVDCGEDLFDWAMERVECPVPLIAYLGYEPTRDQFRYDKRAMTRTITRALKAELNEEGG